MNSQGGFMRDNSQWITVVGLIVSCVIGLTIGKYAQKTASSVEEKVSNNTPIFITQDFGNGVKYFPFTGEKFGKKLSELLGSNTNLEISAISGEVRKHGIVQSFWSSTDGYFVTFREKK